MIGKVLYTTSSASPQSGAFKILLNMSQRIEEYGYKSLLVLPESCQSNSFWFEKIDVQTFLVRLPRVRRNYSPLYFLRFAFENLWSIYQLVKIIRQENVSIVHANEILDVYAVLAARIVGVPCVCSVRADLSEWPILQAILPRIISTLADRVAVASESVQRNLFSYLDDTNDNTRVIYEPGFEFGRFHPSVDARSVQEEFRLRDDEYVIILVAKLSRRKGHKTLLEAAPLVLRAYPNTRFLLVGGELDGPHHRQYAAELRRLVRNLNIEDEVLFTGFRSDIPELMSAADIVTHCSTYPDPFPGVVLQGMAVGRPVIAPDLGGPKEQIEHNVSGILVEPGQPDALAEAICNLLADEEKREALGEAAVHRTRVFAPERFLGKLTELYDSVLRDDE